MSAAPAIFRVCITGSECTGKTTLARELAGTLGALYVAEHSREYAQARGGLLGPRDVGPIAEGQLAAEARALHATRERMAHGGPALLVLDTDLLSTVVYSRFYYGACPPWIEHAGRAQRADLYLLCDFVPWLPDGVRDMPHARDAIQAAFVATLGEFGAVTEIIKGNAAERLALCRAKLQAR